MVGTQVSAQTLFRAAYENRYTWDKSFPGYAADVTYTRDGEVLTGQIQIGADLKPHISGIEDAESQNAIHGQLFEIAIHRIRRSFEETHGKNTFTYGQTLTDGSIEILMGGKAEGDRYHVRDNEVTMVHRQIHGIVVTIHTFSSHDTGAGYLSHRYDSVYHDPATGEQKGGSSEFEDTYEQVGNYFILNRRHIVTQEGDRCSTQEFVFSHICLLG